MKVICIKTFIFSGFFLFVYLIDTLFNQSSLLSGPPVPPQSVRVTKRSSKIKSSSILFRFNCSWFSDTNGAVRYFTVIVAESDGTNTPTHVYITFTYIHVQTDKLEVDKFFCLFWQPMKCCSQNSATHCPHTATTSATHPSEPIRLPTSPAAVHRTLRALLGR